jgi:hypothetical protein
VECTYLIGPVGGREGRTDFCELSTGQAALPQGRRFGYAGAGGRGARAVLEVRSREVPFILEHGQIVGRLVYERMLERPHSLYGERIGSNYQAQGLKLSKHFRT